MQGEQKSCRTRVSQARLISMENACPPGSGVDSAYAPAGRGAPGGLAVLTVVVWLTCLGIGVVGLLIPFSRPAPPPEPIAPIEAVMLEVDLAPAVANEDMAKGAAPSYALPPVERPLRPTPVTEMVRVAAPDALVAFALPVDAPAELVPASEADSSGRLAREDRIEGVAGEGVGLAPVQPLVYGLGEGRQPAPEYPLRARRERQEGTVGIRFTVAPSGRVLTAQVSAASPYPMLNEAAVEAIRRRWRFPAGASRIYEVSIRFELKG